MMSDKLYNAVMISLFFVGWAVIIWFAIHSIENDCDDECEYNKAVARYHQCIEDEFAPSACENWLSIDG